MRRRRRPGDGYCSIVRSLGKTVEIIGTNMARKIFVCPYYQVATSVRTKPHDKIDIIRNESVKHETRYELVCEVIMGNSSERRIISW